MDNKVAVIGAGGHAKVIIAMLRLRGYQPVAVLDDNESLWGTELLGVTISGPIGSLDASRYNWGVIGIGNNEIRHQVARRVKLRWLSVVHPTAWVDVSVSLGPGTVVFAGAMVQPGCIIGEHVIINTAASVDHDCVLDDFVHIAPGTHLAGNVRVGQGAFMGIGSALIPGVRVGPWTTVGAGAVVVEDLPDRIVAYGVPAVPRRPVEKAGRTMGKARMLSTRDEQEWLEVLQQVAQHDFYHLPQYHALEERLGRGTAYLFAYSNGPYHIALPVILRPIDPRQNLVNGAEHWCDASSVYGYSGPVTSHPDAPRQIIENFHALLWDAFREMEIVTVFSRLHPLLSQKPLLYGLGNCLPSGQTVSIDLTAPLETQRQKYRKGHRSDISKGRNHGVVCHEDTSLSYLEAFVDIYRETMERVAADSFYLFDYSYFKSLVAALGKNAHLFVALLNGELIAGALVVECQGIVQYHLGGARDSAKALAPIKLILDAVRIWATERRFQTFHLGGGVGARDDSLFYFKAGFSDRRHEFSTWQWVVLPKVYEQLCHARLHWDQEHGLESGPAEFFPRYRASPRDNAVQP
jgi:sugar O-acyltransferase (sialic acid O-acetyltransferase NeuD family)